MQFLSIIHLLLLEALVVVLGGDGDRIGRALLGFWSAPSLLWGGLLRIGRIAFGLLPLGLMSLFLDMAWHLLSQNVVDTGDAFEGGLDRIIMDVSEGSALLGKVGKEFLQELEIWGQGAPVVPLRSVEEGRDILPDQRDDALREILLEEGRRGGFFTHCFQKRALNIND